MRWCLYTLCDQINKWYVLNRRIVQGTKRPMLIVHKFPHFARHWYKCVWIQKPTWNWFVRVCASNKMCRIFQSSPNAAKWWLLYNQLTLIYSIYFKQFFFVNYILDVIWATFLFFCYLFFFPFASSLFYYIFPFLFAWFWCLSSLETISTCELLLECYQF